MSLISVIATLGDAVPKESSHINQYRNSTLPNAEVVRYWAGFNEFDIYPCDDGSGDFHMVWDARDDIRYLRFDGTDADLVAKITDGDEVVIKTVTFSYPSILDVAGHVYIYFHDSDGNIKYIEGTGDSYVTELQADTPVVLFNTGASDFSVRPNTAGGYAASGHIGGKNGIWTCATPTGTWAYQGTIFNEDYPIPGFTNQADGMLYFKDNRCYYLFNGFHASRQGTPRSSHNCVVEVSTTTWMAITAPFEIIHQFDRAFHDSLPGNPHAFCYNPVYTIDANGVEKLWYSASSGEIGTPDEGWIANYTLSTNTRGPVRDVNTIAKLAGGNLTDVDTNRYYESYGTITNTVFGGIATSSSASGLWNFLNQSILDEFNWTIEFEVFVLPASEGLICSIGDKDGMYIALTVLSTGALKLYIKSDAGLVTKTPVDTVTVDTRKTFTLSSRRQDNTNGHTLGYKDWTVNNEAPFLVTANFYGLTTYSILNEKTDLLASGKQLNGTIYSMDINGSLYEAP